MMNRILSKAGIFGLTILCAAQANAQQNYGIATSDWSVINSMYLNPANIADSREKFSISVISISAGIDNNLGSLSQGGIIKSLSDGKTHFDFSNSDHTSLLAPYAEIRGPGAVVSINDKHSIAITTAIRGINQFNNFNQSLYHTITDDQFTTDNNIDLNSNKFNYTAHVWSEVGLTYGGVIWQNGHNELKGGVTVRYLGGIGYIGIKGKNLDAHFVAGNDSFHATNSDIEYASNVLSTNSVLDNGISNNSILSEFTSAKAGSGVGGDLGITYDYIQDPDKDVYNMNGKAGMADGSKNRYLFRLSASVVDIGSINYNNNNSTAEVTGNGYLTGNGIANNVTSYTSFRNYAVAQGFTADTGHGSQRVYMPTRLLLSADYHAYKMLYVNAAFSGNLANREAFGNSYYNQFTITPRYDTRLFSVALPVSYSALAHNVRLGVGARVSGFFIGSDDMIALFSHHQYGFNMYVGGSVPFYRKKLKDRDGDGVSDSKDKCPDEIGTWENRGCPADKDMKDMDKDTKEDNAKTKSTDTE